MLFLQVPLPPFWSHDYRYLVYQNAIGCAIGSFFAIGIPLFFYWLTAKAARKAEEESNDVKERNELKAFCLLLKQGMDVVGVQLEYIGQYIKALKDQPDIFPLIKVNTWGSLKRIIDGITVEGTGLTYMKRFPGKGSAREFLDMLELVDLLYYGLVEMVDIAKRASLNHEDRLEKFAEVHDVTDKLIVDHVSKMPKEDPIANGIDRIKKEFIETRKRPFGVSVLYTAYLQPLTELLKRAGSQIAGSDFYKELVYNVSKSEDFYMSVPAGYEQFTREMVEIERQNKKRLEKLKLAAAKILGSEYVS